MEAIESLPGARSQDSDTVTNVILEFYINIVEAFYGVIDEDLTGGLGSTDLA